VIHYLSVEQVLRLHEHQIATFGGSPGLRDRGGLESAVARPAATFDGDDLYPDLASKVGALMHSLVMNHPFVDGNKRVGAMAAEKVAGLEACGAVVEQLAARRYRRRVLKGAFDPMDDYMKSFALIRVGPDAFAPGLYDEKGAIYEVMRSLLLG